MRRLLLAVSVSLLVVAAAVPQRAQEGPPTLPLKPVPDFFKLPPNFNFGETVAVATNSKQHVFVYDRGGVTGPAYGQAAGRVVEFDANGTFVREFAKELYSASYGHGLRVDRHDNIWIADKGSDTIVKMRPDGHVDMVFGRRAEASEPGGQAPPAITRAEAMKNPPAHEPGRFRQPTDIAWDSQDNIYIADGYINSRVAVYNKDGVWQRSFGEQGKGPGQFVNVHNIAIDAKDRIYIADRANARIQVFDHDFRFLHQWNEMTRLPYPATPNWWGDVITPTMPNPQRAAPGGPGAPWSLCFTQGPGKQWLFVGDGFPAKVYKIDPEDGKIVGTFGGQGRLPGQFSWIHGIACPSENEIYAVDENNWRMQKLVAR